MGVHETCLQDFVVILKQTLQNYNEILKTCWFGDDWRCLVLLTSWNIVSSFITEYFCWWFFCSLTLSQRVYVSNRWRHHYACSKYFFKIFWKLNWANVFSLLIEVTVAIYMQRVNSLRTRTIAYQTVMGYLLSSFLSACMFKCILSAFILFV